MVLVHRARCSVARSLDQSRSRRARGQIPFGETRSYQQQAQTVGKPKAVRAVGTANGANPLPIVVPCHRVVGKGGALCGFGGGLDKKRLLLDHEQQVLRTIKKRRRAAAADAESPSH